MLNLYWLVFFCLILFFISCAGFLFTGSMLKKNIFAAVMFLSACILMSCLRPSQNSLFMTCVLLFFAAVEICISLIFVFLAVAENHTLDSAAMKEGN